MGRKRLVDPSIDRFFGVLAFGTLRFNREVDHHDGVLLHNPDQKDDAYERVEAQS